MTDMLSVVARAMAQALYEAGAARRRRNQEAQEAMSECWVCEGGWQAFLANDAAGLTQPICKAHLKQTPPAFTEYNRGWNEAIEATAELAEKPDQKYQRGHTVAAAIRKLKKP